jgi:hypothetical protein
MTSTRKLQNLVNRLARQETQLAALRKRLNARLGRLERRREELRTELQAVETEIAVVAPGEKPEPAPLAANGRRKRGRRSRTTPSLRSILLDLFKKNGRTLSVSELVDQVRKAGYRSQSKDIKNLLWVSLGRMPELERDPKGGYRLKKRKA